VTELKFLDEKVDYYNRPKFISDPIPFRSLLKGTLVLELVATISGKSRNIGSWRSLNGFGTRHVVYNYELHSADLDRFHGFVHRTFFNSDDLFISSARFKTCILIITDSSYAFAAHATNNSMQRHTNKNYSLASPHLPKFKNMPSDQKNKHD
jgi:hypothetical protein